MPPNATFSRRSDLCRVVISCSSERSPGFMWRLATLLSGAHLTYSSLTVVSIVYFLVNMHRILASDMTLSVDLIPTQWGWLLHKKCSWFIKPLFENAESVVTIGVTSTVWFPYVNILYKGNCSGVPSFGNFVVICTSPGLQWNSLVWNLHPGQEWVWPFN